MKIHLFLFSLLAFLVFCSGNVRAGLLSGGDVPNSFTFLLTSSKDPAVARLLHGFQITVPKTANGTGADFILKLTDSGLEAGYGGGHDGVKFRDFVLNNASSYFTTTMIGWDSVWLPSIGTLEFKDGVDWETFAAHVASISMTVHLQSIDTSTQNGVSINEANFTLQPQSPATPEPSTLAVFCIGSLLGGIFSVARTERWSNAKGRLS